MKNFFKTIIQAILAGAFIAIGGTVNLAVGGGPLGAALFTVGLFCVCTMDMSLYTGKVCYVIDNDFKYLLNIIPIWVGNFIGTWLVAEAELYTRIAPKLIKAAQPLIETKLSDNLGSIFILAIFCNIMIYVGVESYKSNIHVLGKYVGLFLGIMVFILCGFEHCVANMYYFAITESWSKETMIYLLVMTGGNAVGGIGIHLLRKLAKKKAE